MSVLLLHLDPPLAASLARRLATQGDEVRWVGPSKHAEELRGLGAYIARGDLDDDDFIWRAAQGCRTVVFDTRGGPEKMAAIIKGAKSAEVERLVCVADGFSREAHDRLSASGLEYAFILTGGGNWLARRKVATGDLTEAIDAADDRSGPMHEVLDLTEESGWERLGLLPPTKRRSS